MGETVQPVVSVIIPVYNVEHYLAQCLDSVLSQTLENIEVICVDDSSQDSSRQTVIEYAKRDPRIVPILHEENLGTAQTRKDGVAASTGRYIMFVDGDDTIVPEACERAAKAIETYGTDIVQFDTLVVNCAGVSEARILSNQKALRPWLERIEEDNLIFACWEEKKFSFNLWNKIYRGDLCRRAFHALEDGYYPKAQDLYAFFAIAYYAKSYMGIEDVLYHYNFGVGITGSDQISLSKFDVLLTQKEIWAAVCRFLERNGEALDTFQSVTDTIYKGFLGETVNKWFRNVAVECSSEGFQHMVDVWGFRDILCTLAELKWFNRDAVGEKMLDVACFQRERVDVTYPLTIAAYYHTIHNGGAQRVVSQLCNLWVEMKDSQGNYLYNVILITDVGPGERDYPLNKRVQREYLPDFQTAMKEDYRERYDAWTCILDKHPIDLVISSAWVAPCTLWDMLCVKGYSRRTAFVIHAHNFCCQPFQFNGSDGLEMIFKYQLCDGVVTLSDCDRQFAECFSNDVRYIVNPLPFAPEQTECSGYEPNTLVWVGRISEEKQPLDAVHMMNLIVQEMPDATLYMVGDGDEKLLEQIRALIETLGLQENVILTGFTLDVERYYRHASVLVGTSMYEGFPLTFGEALAHSVPIITYDLPWLTYVQDGRGIVTVKQGRYDLLAKEAITLLRDQTRVRQLGAQGNAHLRELASVDIGQEWKTFIEAAVNGTADMPPADRNESILFEYLTRYQQIGRTNALNLLNDKLQKAYAEKSEINRKLQVTYGEKFDRGVQIKELKKQQKELKKDKERLKKELSAMKQENADLKKKNKAQAKKLNALRHSSSFRIGRIVTWPVRKMKILLRRLRKKSAEETGSNG